MMKSIYLLCRRMIFYFCSSLPFVQLALAQCDKPAALSVSDATDQAVTLHWVHDYQVIEFEVDIRSKGRTPKLKKTLVTSSTSLQIQELMAGSDYRFRVRSLCDPNASSGSTSWFAFKTTGMSPDENCPKATDLHIVGSTMTTATLAWTGDEFSSHYEVEVRSKGNTPVYYFEKSLLDTSLTIFGLNPTGLYQFRVRTTCVNSAVSGSTAWLQFKPENTIPKETCPFASNLVADSITPNSAVITWNMANQLTTYELNVYDVQGNEIVFAPAFSPQVIANLLPDTEYTVDIISNCDAGIPSQSSLKFRTKNLIQDSCATPENLGATMIDSANYRLNWDSIEGAESYNLEIYNQDSIPILLVDTNLYATEFVFGPIDVAEHYTFRVGAMCVGSQPGQYSLEYSFPLQIDSLVLACDIPIGFDVDTVIGNHAFVRWINNGAAAFELEVQNADTSWNTIYSSSSPAPIQVLSDLTPFTTHQVRLRALCDRENSEFTSAIEFSTFSILSLCLPPTNLTASRLDDSTASLLWMGDDSSSYEVEIKQMDTMSELVLVVPAIAPSALVSGLSLGVDYQFRVRKICSEGDTSFYTNWIPFNTADTLGPQCEIPTAVMLDSLTDTEAWIKWEGEELSQYRLLIKERDTIVEYDQVLSEEHFIYLDHLLPKTEYEVFVQTICGIEESGLSEPLYFTTLMMGDSIPDSISCLSPNLIVLDSIDATEAWLSWDGDDSLTYLVEVIGNDFEWNQSLEGPYLHLADLTPDSEFSLRLRAICLENDTSTWSETFVFQTLSLPVMPKDSCPIPQAELVEVLDQIALVSWTSSSAGAFYLLEVENMGLTPEFNLITTTRDTNYRIEGLIPGGNYQWKIAAFCEGGTFSECTPWMMMSTAGQTECPVPSNLGVEMVTKESVRLTWGDIEGSIDYEVEIQSIDTTEFVSLNEIVTGSEISIDGLMAGGLYQFKVNVQCADGSISEDSDWLVFATLTPQDTGSILAGNRPSVHLVFPNPVQQIMNVQLPDLLKGQDALIELSDMMGRMLLSRKTLNISGKDRLQLEVGDLREGIYKLSVKSAENHFHELVLISH